MTITTPAHKAQKKSRRGFLRHETNPFLDQLVIHEGEKLIEHTAESNLAVTERGTNKEMARVKLSHEKKIDKTQFIMIYSGGASALTKLSKAGIKVFEVLYLELQKSPNKDVVYLSEHAVDQSITPMERGVFLSGIKNLIENNFLAEHKLEHKFFINPCFIWNGNRRKYAEKNK